MPTKHLHKVHISGIQSFKRCRQAWFWNSPQGLNLTPRDKYIPYFTGSLVHHCLEYRYKFGTPVETAIATYLEANCSAFELADNRISEQVALVTGMLKHYDLWQHHDTTWLSDDNFDFIDNERPFKAHLWNNTRHSIELRGTYDGVVKSRHNGKYYLWEIKTTRSITEREKQLDLDSQTDAYINAASRELELPISGVIYTLLLKKVPDQPKVLANGTLSQALTQDTTADWYLDAAKTHHSGAFKHDHAEGKALIKALYSDVLNQLLVKENKYFKRVVISRSKVELDDSWRQLQSVAKEMINPKIAIYRSEDNACNYCIFRDPCIAKRKGENFNALLNSNFVFNNRYIEEVSE